MAVSLNSEIDFDNTDDSKKNNTFTLCTTGTIVGATVSALVYSAIQTTGEITASVASTGINLAGETIALGTDYVVGVSAGNTVRALAHTTGALTAPTIKSTSQTAALGVSVLAGTMSAITTSLVIYGTKELITYTSKITEKYKETLAKKIQYPVESDGEILELENEPMLLLTESESNNS
jgi:hypothetical protein